MKKLEFKKQPKPSAHRKNGVVRQEAAVVFYVLLTAALLAYAVGTLVSGR